MLLSFIITCIVIELTPGPNMAYLAVLSISEGKKAGYAATVGIALGLLIIGIISALGVATLISNSPIAYQTLKYSGTFYLLWLAWDTWKPQEIMSTKELKDVFYHAKFFKRGLITNLLNPKAAVFYIAILPKFINADSQASTQAIILTLMYILVATSIHTVIVTLSGTTRKLIENNKQRLVIRRILAFALVLISFWFLLET